MTSISIVSKEFFHYFVTTKIHGMCGTCPKSNYIDTSHGSRNSFCTNYLCESIFDISVDRLRMRTKTLHACLKHKLEQSSNTLGNKNFPKNLEKLVIQVRPEREAGIYFQFKLSPNYIHYHFHVML